MEKEQVTIKLHTNDGIRRFGVAPNISFAALKQEIQRYHTGQAKLTYVDDEGDYVTLESESDWEEALRLLDKQSKILHVHLSISVPISKEEKKEETEKQQDGKEEEKKTGDGPVNQGNLPEKLVQLARTPQAANFLAQLGLNPNMAEGLIHQFLGGQGGAGVDGGAGVNNNNNNNATTNSGPDVVGICDSCDGVIEPSDVRFHCSVCPDYDLHEKCYAQRKHDESHLFFTQYATEEKVKNLIEVGGADRDLCVEYLNLAKGDFDRALEKLLEVK